jgi:hypothetical protein
MKERPTAMQLMLTERRIALRTVSVLRERMAPLPRIPILTTVTTFDIVRDKTVEKASSSADKRIWYCIVFVGYTLDAHRTGKESVSCQKGTVGFTDIHISLARVLLPAVP